LKAFQNSKKEKANQESMALTVLPITAKKEQGVFDLYAAIINALKFNNMDLKDGDVLVISSKYVSFSQGRLVSLENIIPSKEGFSLS
ncbi:hypothetical protein DF186_18980, partial [Enterococcus hirae]